jgi:Lon protease-like protein
MFPLETVLLPGGILPLHVFEPRFRQMMTDCLDGDGDGTFGVVLISRGSEVGGGDQRVAIGTETHIEGASRFPDGRWAVIARGIPRVAVESWLPDDPYPVAIVRPLPVARVEADPVAVEKATAVVRRARALVSELGQAPFPVSPLEADATIEGADAPVWHLCAAAPLGPLDRQRLLETDDATERVLVLTELSLQVHPGPLLAPGRRGFLSTTRWWVPGQASDPTTDVASTRRKATTAGSGPAGVAGNSRRAPTHRPGRRQNDDYGVRPHGYWFESQRSLVRSVGLGSQNKNRPPTITGPVISLA